MNMVNQAEKYIYMDTPYLILNTPMQSSLMLAAKNGVDVRIMTPYIPDKILVNQITKANYLPLLQSGVRIYEYLPGFDHSKNFVSDDKTAIIGSANMDYRSYFLHFENGVLMADTDEILKIRDDFLAAAQAAKEITIADVEKTILPVRIVRAVLNLFIPLV
jgi:cardiolipin synthase